MNVYDQAHNLALAIKEAEEYKQFIALKERLDGNPELSKMIRDFEKKQLEIQTKQMMGEGQSPDIMQSMQEALQIVMKDPLAAEYLQAEMRFSLMMKDVYEILGSVVDLGAMFGGPNE